VKRGEVWWADLPPPAGRRPVVLLSRDDAYAVRSLATIAPVTTRIRDIPSEVRLGTAEGLPRDSVANLDTITTIPIADLTERLAVLSPEKTREVDDAIHFALGLTR
jgi:mRNA interferase MazF